MHNLLLTVVQIVKSLQNLDGVNSDDVLMEAIALDLFQHIQ